MPCSSDQRLSSVVFCAMQNSGPLAHETINWPYGDPRSGIYSYTDFQLYYSAIYKGMNNNGAILLRSRDMA